MRQLIESILENDGRSCDTPRITKAAQERVHPSSSSYIRLFRACQNGWESDLRGYLYQMKARLNRKTFAILTKSFFSPTKQETRLSPSSFCRILFTDNIQYCAASLRAVHSVIHVPVHWCGSQGPANTKSMVIPEAPVSYRKSGWLLSILLHHPAVSYKSIGPGSLPSNAMHGQMCASYHYI